MVGWRARLLARRGLRRGAHTRQFTPDELLGAAEAAGAARDENVYVDVAAGGQLAARGGPASAVLAARLAPAPPLATVLLCLERAAPLSAPLPAPSAAPAPAALRLRLAADVAPLHELLLWFDEPALAALDMPFLTLQNISGQKCYPCHRCGAQFEQPNPLKVHLFLACSEASPAALWARVATRLRATAPALAGCAGAPDWEGARLEALAAAWGRGRGHACVFCGKLYSRRYGLKIHIRTHTGYKPLRCRHCLRAFGDPSNLNKHVRLHEAGEGAAAGARGATHACGVCGRRLARRRDLLRHLRAHHPPAPADAGRVM